MPTSSRRTAPATRRFAGPASPSPFTRCVIIHTSSPRLAAARPLRRAPAPPLSAHLGVPCLAQILPGKLDELERLKKAINARALLASEASGQARPSPPAPAPPRAFPQHFEKRAAHSGSVRMHAVVLRVVCAQWGQQRASLFSRVRQSHAPGFRAREAS